MVTHQRPRGCWRYMRQFSYVCIALEMLWSDKIISLQLESIEDLTSILQQRL